MTAAAIMLGLAVAWLAGFLAGVNWAQAWAEGVADDGDD